VVVWALVIVEREWRRKSVLNSFLAYILNGFKYFAVVQNKSQGSLCFLGQNYLVRIFSAVGTDFVIL